MVKRKLTRTQKWNRRPRHGGNIGSTQVLEGSQIFLPKLENLLMLGHAVVKNGCRFLDETARKLASYKFKTLSP